MAIVPPRCEYMDFDGKQCNNSARSLPNDGTAPYCQVHYSLATLPEQATFREIAAHHLVSIQEFWTRTNIHIVIQIGLLGAFTVLAPTRETMRTELLLILGFAGVILSYVGALVITRSLYLMRCWEAATFMAESAIGMDSYQKAYDTFVTKSRLERPEDIIMYRVSSTTLATALPWAFAVVWPILTLLVVQPGPPLTIVLWVVFAVSTVLFVLYFCALFMMKR